MQQKIKCSVAYDGSRFFGFQKQPNQHTVQGEIERAFSTLGLAEKIAASGRTDRGVHALGQVFHTTIPQSRSQDLEQIRHQLNHQLPPTIIIRKILSVPENFHARFTARKRTYLYLLHTGRFSPFLESYACQAHIKDFAEMITALHVFNGEHNFEYFRKTGSNELHTVRAIYRTACYQMAPDKILLRFDGNAFLRSQIRLMVGFLIEIGNHHLSIKQLSEQLSKTALYHTKPAPSGGLYLARITY